MLKSTSSKPDQTHHTTSSHLMSRFYTSSLLVALALAVIAVLVFSFPVNRAVTAQVRDRFINAVEIRATIADATIERFINNTESLGSRTAIRERLYEFTRGRVDFSELVSFTEPKYRDGARVLDDLVGARRSLADRTPVAGYGNTEVLNSLAGMEPGVYLVRERDKTLVAVIRSLREANETIGYDATLFDGSSLLDNAPKEVRRFTLQERDTASAPRTSPDVHQVELDGCPFILEGEANPEILRAERMQVFTSLAAYTLLLFALTMVLFYFTVFRFGKRLVDRLDRSVREKSLFLRESIHRIKNSFASVEALLGLKRDAETNPEATRALREAITVVSSNRILYEKLLRTDEHQKIGAKSYLTDLARSVLEAFSAAHRIRLQPDIEDIHLESSDAVPLGAIVAELLTNAVKHAYPEQEHGVVTISLKSEESSAVLEVSDEGQGFPETLDPATSDSFGLSLVHSLAEQVGGSAEIQTGRGAGTRTTIRFTP